MYICILCIYVCVIHVCYGVYVKVKGQLVGVSFLPLLFGSLGSNAGPQSWLQTPLSTQPSP